MYASVPQSNLLLDPVQSKTQIFSRPASSNNETREEAEMMNGGGIPLGGSPGQNGFYQNGYSLVGAPPQQAAAFAPGTCRRCGHVGCDLQIKPCGCIFHARCLQMTAHNPLSSCPACHTQVQSIYLMPMDFSEIDQARQAAASMAPSSKRGKKRKNATIARLNPQNSLGTNGTDDSGDGADLRTGRWTTEETEYCDKLISAYESGELPIAEGVKLNDFLATMLKSKQSRLTKKMKNAKLSAKTYKPETGYVVDDEDAKKFSALEVSFYESIQCDMERAEIRFHMQKEWREFFTTYCASIGQKLDANAWLSSAEELDRRASQAKDAARMARRKVMMGYALTQDAMNPQTGVFIDTKTLVDGHRSDQVLSSGHSAMNTIATMSGKYLGSKGNDAVARSIRDFSSPFVGRVIQYIEKHHLPFEHIDAWVPSFVSQTDDGNLMGAEDAAGNDQKCRLCFAGYASTNTEVPVGGGRPTPLSSNMKFDLYSFGEYSSKFSFDVGCGLPGRVYSSGICSWEQGVENAPSHQFERCGGAAQWGIKTVLGVPIPSPNVGRIVMLLYSRTDRIRDPEMVRRVTEELTKLMPTPKWKLVVDIGSAPPKVDEKVQDKRIPDLLKLLAENMPTSSSSPLVAYLPGFTALRLLLLKRNKTPEDNDYANTMLDSYSSYLSNGKTRSETASLVARDFMLLNPAATAQHPTAIPQSFQSIPPGGQQQQRVAQVQHQPLQQQLGHLQHAPSNLQHQQHNPSALAQHMQQQLQHNHFQPGALQHQQHQQQNPGTVTLGAPAPGLGASIARAPTPQGGASPLAAFSLASGQNNLSQNGIAALSHMAQHMAHTNGVSTLQNDKSGVPGA